MRIQHSTLLLSFLIPMVAFTQINVGGLPYSSIEKWENTNLNEVRPVQFDAKAAALQDADRDAKGELPLYGRMLDLNVSLTSVADVTTLPNGDRVARLKVTSSGAASTELFFSTFKIPLGGVVYVYNEDKSEMLGGFTGYNEGPDGTFTTAMIIGETSIIEYHEPAEHTGQGSIVISHVGHAYRMAPGLQKADDCEVDVVCSPEGDGWSAQRDGVVRISVVSPQGLGWCTGSVVNNTASDCAPYVLTAWHCGNTSSTANFNSYKFYFRYQRNNCNTGLAFATKVMTGCTKVADSRINSNNDGSDFLLLEANSQIPNDFTPFFAGWNATTSLTSSGKCIHHPAGSEKKISQYAATPTSATWSGSPFGVHLRVTWTGSSNGHGVTEGGSSGSPLYNSSKNIIGTLTGGASFCNSVQPGGQTQPDFYGKMSYHWNSNGTTANKQLEPFLDPTGSGVMELDGSHNPCGTYTVFTDVYENTTSEGFSIIPNPTAGNVVLRIPKEHEVSRIVLTDMAGRVVMEVGNSLSGDVELDLHELVRGTYGVQLFDGDHVVSSQKVICM